LRYVIVAAAVIIVPEATPTAMFFQPLPPLLFLPTDAVEKEDPRCIDKTRWLADDAALSMLNDIVIKSCRKSTTAKK
jgi:hypothetical protein